MNSVLGEAAELKPVFSADEYHDMIDAKVADIRNATASADPSIYAVNSASSSLTRLEEVSIEDVVAAITASVSKQCEYDPLPTWLLKKCCPVLAPYIKSIFNSSLSTGQFPAVWKTAIIRPILKKSGLDEAVPSNYRPVANLPFLSKVLERLVLKQLIAYLESHDLLPEMQSAYRKYHSTETAVLRFYSDLVDAIERGEFALLTLLDLSAAFDTVDHE